MCLPLSNNILHIMKLGFEAHFCTSQMTNAMNLSVCIFADAHNTTNIE